MDTLTATPNVSAPQVPCLPSQTGINVGGRWICVADPVTIEANLTGTPVLGSSYGSFTETIQQGITGYRCATLGDWLAAIERIEEWGQSSAAAFRKSRARNTTCSCSHMSMTTRSSR